MTTIVQNKQGEAAAHRVFSPGDDVPDWAAKQMGDHCFTNKTAPAAGDGPPPKAGAGSTRDAWATYAAEQGIDVPDDATRDGIIQSLADAGKPVDPK